MVGIRCCSRLQDLYIPIAVILIVLLQGSVLVHKASANDVDFLLDSSLQDLLDIEVMTVSRRSQNLVTAPAAIYVLTGEDLKRRGVTSIPEALRMVPGLYVAAIDGNKWVVSSRGFAGRYSNKLLVQVDGRSVYTPSYSGVYWDMQDLLLEDIDRIEVVRGPGAALWGANAVNGIINILTKSAEETQGGVVTLASGNQLEHSISARYGQALSTGRYGRVYVKKRQYQSNKLVAGGDAEDDWRSFSTGFRVDDHEGERNHWTFQGDFTKNRASQLISILWQPAPIFLEQGVEDNFDARGWNLLGRWEHQHDNQSSSTLQIYWDHTERDEIYLAQEHDILDIDFQNQALLGGEHTLVYGFGYRRTLSDYTNSYSISVTPDSAQLTLLSAFIQGEYVITPEELNLTVGSKIEKNDLTGTEVQPSIRLMWVPQLGHNIWSSVSRAVRTPSMIETNGNIVSRNFPAPVSLVGSEEMDAEVLTAYELGYRYYANPHFTLDTALFYNKYDKYVSFEPVSQSDILTANLNSGHAYGIEISGVWQILPWWQLESSYSWVEVKIDPKANSVDLSSGSVVEGSAPEHQLTLQSSMNLTDQWQLDLWLYAIDKVDTPSSSAGQQGVAIDAYTSVNARVSWKPMPELEISVMGNNLLDQERQESLGEFFSSPTEIQRSFAAELRWNF